MDRTNFGLEGLERVDSDQCMSIRGGSGTVLKAILKFLIRNAEELIEGFIEGWNGEEIIQTTEAEPEKTN